MKGIEMNLFSKLNCLKLPGNLAKTQAPFPWLKIHVTTYISLAKNLTSLHPSAPDRAALAYRKVVKFDFLWKSCSNVDFSASTRITNTHFTKRVVADSFGHRRCP